MKIGEEGYHRVARGEVTALNLTEEAVAHAKKKKKGRSSGRLLSPKDIKRISVDDSDN